MRLSAIPVYVLVIGMNRSLSYTHPSIEAEILKPIRRLPWLDVQPSLTLLETSDGGIDNPRSAERGALENNVPASWNEIPILSLNTGDLEQEGEHSYRSLAELPDRWSDHYRSLKNVLNELVAQNRAFNEFVIGREPGIVVFCRPDCMVGERFGLGWKMVLLSMAHLFSLSVALVPNWGSHGGVNDRFGIFTGDASKAFFGRIKQAGDFRPATGWHAEEYLASALRGVHVIRLIRGSIVRIRVGGRVEERDAFLLRKNFQRLLWRKNVQRRKKNLRRKFRRLRRRIGRYLAR